MEYLTTQPRANLFTHTYDDTETRKIMYFLDIELYTTGVRVIRNPELAQPRVDIPESATTCTASIDGTTIRVREEQLNKASWAILSRSREPVTIELPGEIE